MTRLLLSIRNWALLTAVGVSLAVAGCGESAKTTPTTTKPDASKTDKKADEAKTDDKKAEDKKPEETKPTTPPEGGSAAKGKAGGGVDVPSEK